MTFQQANKQVYILFVFSSNELNIQWAVPSVGKFGQVWKSSCYFSQCFRSVQVYLANNVTCFCVWPKSYWENACERGKTGSEKKNESKFAIGIPASDEIGFSHVYAFFFSPILNIKLLLWYRQTVHFKFKSQLSMILITYQQHVYLEIRFNKLCKLTVLSV